MSQELTFGFAEREIRLIRIQVELVLGRTLEEHHSSFYAGTYFRSEGPDLERVILQQNFDIPNQEWTEEAHTGLPVLLIVSGLQDPEATKRAMDTVPGCTLVREASVSEARRITDDRLPGMGRLKRILMNLLLPGVAAGSLIVVAGIAVGLAANGLGTWGAAGVLGALWGGVVMMVYVVLMAYLYALLPSALSTFIMEWFYRRRGLAPQSWKAVGLSTLCGAGSGFLIDVFFEHGPGIDEEGQRLLMVGIALGGATGLFTGVLVKISEERALRGKPTPSREAPEGA